MSKVTEEMVTVARDNFRKYALSTVESRLRSALQALFDAKLISLPVDEAAIREAAIRECVAALPMIMTNTRNAVVDTRNTAIEACYHALQCLLTPKDRAEELAEEYWRETHGQDASGGQMLVRAVNFARWLIEREGANG